MENVRKMTALKINKWALIKELFKNRQLSLTDAVELNKEQGILTDTDIKNGINTLHTRGILVKCGTKPLGYGRYKNKLISVYRLAKKGEASTSTSGKKRLTSAKLPISVRKELMIRYMPQFFLYAKELKLSQELLK